MMLRLATGLIALTALGPVLGLQSPEPAIALRGLGTHLSGQLAGGASATYAVMLSAGDFIHVIVDQQGIDVRLRFIDPQGRIVVDADSKNGARGLERVAYVAAGSGEYRLNVLAGAAAGPGTFDVTVAALEKPTERDLMIVAAERAYEGATREQDANTLESRRRAIEGYRRAEALFTSSGRGYESALTMLSEGLVDMASGQPRAALDVLSKALVTTEHLHESSLLVSVLNTMGGAHDILGNLATAMEQYERALAIARTTESSPPAVILNNIGKLYYDLSDWQRSLQYYRQALDAFSSTNNLRRQGITTHNLGVVYARLGDPETAMAHYQRALGLRRRTGDKDGEASTLITIGDLYRELGQLERALEPYDQALLLWRTIGDRRGEARALVAMADAHQAAGRRDLARPLYEQALTSQRSAGDRRSEAMTLGKLAKATHGDSASALDFAQQALVIFRAIGDRQNVADMLAESGRAARDLGRLDEAGRAADEALAMIEDVRGRVVSDDLRASYLAGRHDAYLLDIDVRMALDARDPSTGHAARAFETSERSRARSLLDLLTASGARVRQGVDAALVDREQRLSQDINAKGARLMTAAAADRETLGREVQTLETEYSEVQAAIRRTSPAYAALTQPRPLTVAEIQRDLLDDETVLLEYSLGETASYLWRVDRQSLTTYKLPPADVISAAVQDVRQLSTMRPAGAVVSQRVRRAVAKLSEMVVAPLGVGIAGKRLAIVSDGALEYVPFAMLALPGTPGVPLVTACEIVSLPSASSLAVVRAQMHDRERPTRGIAVLADPVFQTTKSRPVAANSAQTDTKRSLDDEERLFVHDGAGPTSGHVVIPRLPFTRAEAASVLRSSPDSDNFQALGFAATKDLVVGGQLRPYRFVHFATHGYLDAERPQLSAIVLSMVDRDGTPRDGFLRAHELYNLELRADLVVLSACETGLGKEVKGEGLVGLTRGFMYAGAPRVAVSLWSVSDRATAALMGHFYEEMLKNGKPPAAALRAAQLTMMKEQAWRNPYYWAAFVIQGDWR